MRFKQTQIYVNRKNFDVNTKILESKWALINYNLFFVAY
jgi:hypothetical protein